MRRVSWLITKPAQYYKGIRIKADVGLHEQLADIIVSTLPDGARIIDYGAGAGALSQRLADLGYDVLAVDVDQGSYEATPPFERLDFNRPDEIVRFGDRHQGEFDLALGIEVIEHVENPWQYVRDLNRLVKPGGWVLISTPNVTSWLSRVHFFLSGRFHQFDDQDRLYGHINPVAEDELRLILERSGLLVERVLPGGWLPHLWLSRVPRDMLRNLFGFFGSWFMQGTWHGWCLIALARKESVERTANSVRDAEAAWLARASRSPE